MENPDLPTMTTIERSSQIHSIGHKDGHLYIIFKNYKGELSRPYRYAPKAGAPAHEHHHAQIQSAESAGRYVNQHIKNGGYTFEKL
jgi:hypothetical protein